MTMNKYSYYTPKMNEFYIGFEYEYNINGEWASVGYHPIDMVEYERFQSDLYDKNLIRVKYLDKKDIESFGFETEDGGECYDLQINFDLYGLYPLDLEHEYKITKDNDTLFQGTIRNKSELKKLLQQLNIIN